jgi:hypothetical protein
MDSLNREQLLKAAPSIFAVNPSVKVSEKYAFIPTTRVIETLEREGWKPFTANQAMCRTTEGRDFVKHVIRFRKDGLSMEGTDSVPELVITNSHNGLAAFNLMLGVYRLICANGMIAGDTFLKESVKHIGYTDDKVLDASYRLISEVPRITASVQEMSQIQLTDAERIAFAKSAMPIKFSEETTLEPQKLLTVRHYEDRDKKDLWTTFNAVQENMIRGGLRSYSRNENGYLRRQRTREVKSVNEDIRINKALWTLVEEMKKLKVS